MKMLQRTLSAIVIAGLATVVVNAQEWAKAVSLFNQKQYREALKEFHSVLRLNPEYWQAWYYIGTSHFELKGYEDSIDAFNNYIKAVGMRQQEQGTAHYYIGFSHYQLKQYDKAIPALQRYLTLFSTIKEKIDPSARAALGRCFIFTERYNEAIPHLSAAAAEMKSNSANHYYVGFAHFKLNRPDDAITALNQALIVDPKDPDSLTLLADIHLGRIKQNPASVKQAIASGEKLIAVRNDETAWRILGTAYLNDKQFAKAAPHLEKYARAHADSAGAWFNLGLALSRSDQFKPAAAALEQAVKLAPSNFAALIELGYVYEADKQLEKALPAYERAFEASGRRDENARTSIERVKQLLGRG
jgi:tetratricopeptide (TPR) repeat protein